MSRGGNDDPHFATSQIRAVVAALASGGGHAAGA
jgi:hypothetical protein